MKLAKQTKKGFQYRLNREDVEALRFLVRQFPLTAFSPVKISKTDTEAEEREKLLNESLSEHRDGLKRKARNFIRRDKFKISGKNRFYHLSLEAREAMLQILNDMRVESWRALGEPENLEVNVYSLTKERIKYYRLMYLSGYFEHHFLNLEDEKE